MRVPNPIVKVITWSTLMRLKRRFEVAVQDGSRDLYDREELPLARFKTHEEALAYAEKVRAFLASPQTRVEQEGSNGE